MKAQETIKIKFESNSKSVLKDIKEIEKILLRLKKLGLKITTEA